MGGIIFNRCLGGVARAKHAILYNRKDERTGDQARYWGEKELRTRINRVVENGMDFGV